MRIGKKLLLLGLSVALAQPGSSRAQAVGESQLQTFTKSDFYSGLLRRNLAALPEVVFKKCPTLASNGSRVTVLKPVSFGADGQPNAGLWKHAFPVSGCGDDTVLNFYFFVGADGKLNTITGVPGTSNADPTLQRDTLLYANAGAALVAKGCRDFIVKNTKFEAFGLSIPPMPDPGPGQRLRPWWETWTMVGCGRTIDVPLNFAPDETGTQITQPGHAVEH